MYPPLFHVAFISYESDVWLNLSVLNPDNAILIEEGCNPYYLPMSSPDETKTSYSEAEKLLLISKDFFINSFVTPLIAEETTITL